MMPRFMLDTDTCSYIMKRSHARLLARLQRVPVADVCISVVTRAELMYGVEVSPRRAEDLAALAAFLPYVTWDNLYHGQVDFMLLVLVTVGLWLISRKRPVAGGVLLAAAANVKPFLAILLLYLIWRCRWRAVLTMGIAGATLLVLSFLPTLGQGTAVLTGWMEASRGMGVPPLSGHSFNHSIYGTLVRLFSHVRYYSMPNNLLPEPVVPELMQGRASPRALADAVLEFLDDERRRRDLAERFRDLRRQLRGDASSRAAGVIAAMLAERRERRR